MAMNWFDYNIQVMLYMKFMLPAQLISMNNDMANILKFYSLNGIKSYNLCKPY
jgi:hypothetical protein